MEVKDRKVTVIGFGESGQSAARFLHKRGAKVTVADCLSEEELGEEVHEFEELGIGFRLGRKWEEAVRDCELVILSPGVPLEAVPVRLAFEMGIAVVSEIELFFWYCNSPVVAVTGTNGKTTTVSIIGKLLSSLGFRVKVGGNIGVPLTEIAENLDSEEIVVAEVSSFQLEAINSFRPKISVLLNLSVDHLDRHCSFEEYARAKGRIFENQDGTDFSVLNFDDVEVMRISRLCKAKPFYFSVRKNLEEGIFLDSGRIALRWLGKEEEICPACHIKLRGEHNLENSLAALAVAAIYAGMANLSFKADLGWQEKAVSVIGGFKGLEHRLEYIKTVNGISFYDDSKATNVSALVKAICSFQEKVILICGGRSKGADFTPLREAVRNKVKKALLVGEAAENLAKVFDGAIDFRICGSFRSAAKSAFFEASAGDVVLLSPACSSFDMFKDYRERGRVFRAEVENFAKLA